MQTPVLWFLYISLPPKGFGLLAHIKYCANILVFYQFKAPSFVALCGLPFRHMFLPLDLMAAFKVTIPGWHIPLIFGMAGQAWPVTLYRAFLRQPTKSYCTYCTIWSGCADTAFPSDETCGALILFTSELRLVLTATPWRWPSKRCEKERSEWNPCFMSSSSGFVCSALPLTPE